MLVDLLLISFVKLFQVLLRLLPEKGQHLTGLALGRFAFFLLKGRRAVALSNIRRAFKHFDHDEATDVARRCFQNLGINFVEALILPSIPKDRYGERFTIENLEHFERALELKRGVLGLVFHYANWEIMGVTGWFLKNPIIALARPLKGHKLLNDFLNRLRTSTGLTIIPNADTSKDVIRYLRENRIIGILGDQREKRSQGVYVDFFGEPVPTNRGIATISMRTGVPVVPFHFVRQGFLRYRIVCSPPIEMERKGNIEELIYKNTRKINAFLETLIIENPAEWFWVHRRWGRVKSGKRR